MQSSLWAVQNRGKHIRKEIKYEKYMSTQAGPHFTQLFKQTETTHPIIGPFYCGVPLDYVFNEKCYYIVYIIIRSLGLYNKLLGNILHLNSHDFV